MVMVGLAVLAVLAVAVTVVKVQVLTLYRPVQMELVILAAAVAVLASKTHLMYQVTAVTAALVS
jgi:hypothetical protein